MGSFLWQAEDGIRYLVRSRGLGDVYKRQGQQLVVIPGFEHKICRAFFDGLDSQFYIAKSGDAVSYTHLTLPTSDLV